MAFFFPFCFKVPTQVRSGEDLFNMPDAFSDLRLVDEMDPSLADGHTLIYDREVPVELRTADAKTSVHDVGSSENLRIKLLLREGEHIRIELMSENDLFFHYTCSITAAGYRQLTEDQRLLVDFAEFPAILIKMLNRCIRSPQLFFAVLVLQVDGSAALEFLQNIEHKFLDLLVLPFAESPEFLVRQQIAFRYNTMKAKVALLAGRITDLSSVAARPAVAVPPPGPPPPPVVAYGAPVLIPAVGPPMPRPHVLAHSTHDDGRWRGHVRR